ncbi:Protein ASPARTIC PROTEASE IN GUARD CELL 1 [Acorus calamus]|uniref:Protein ASPARTIC PROTEASE IN GUARD CELL 1 n=1 Tax=Acorus calamus TaxID=4465 RepID=A0AAV9FCS3_ACOCL|nr:Protein ASPARTIC PROTEASE IN GUARD CELL 1 [Acorus calamus]
MAEAFNNHHHHPPKQLLLFSLLLLSLVPLSLSRSLPSQTTTLSVFESLLKTQTPLTAQPIPTTTPSSPLSLLLHSRDSLHQTHHTDYASLTLSRLTRDSARVRSLQSRLSLSLHPTNLKPLLDQDLTQSDLEGPIVSGTSQGSGEYFSRLGIGRPPKPLFVVLDTGSDVTWVQCSPCTDCYQQSDPLFDPSSSSSYSPLPCDSSQCHSLDVSACRNGSCLYQVSYGDGSYTVGDFATESLTLGPSSADRIAVGCGHDNEGLFVGAAGLLGLGAGPLSFPSQLKVDAFSYCLVDRDSSASSTLDFGASAAADAAAVSAPLMRNPKMETFYYVGMTGMSVGGELLSIPASLFAVDEAGEGGVIVDSGTAVTRLQTEAYGALRDAFKRGTKGLPAAEGVALFDTCYDLSGRESVEVPTVAFHFPGGKSLPLPAKNYLIPVNSDGTFCFAFAPTGTGGLSIIGNVQQQGTRVSFDRANSLVSFSPNKC